MDELLQALRVAVVKELLLEVGPWRLGGGTLWRRHGHIARGQYLHLAVGSRRKLYPIRVRIRGGAGAASEERAQSQIAEGEAKGIGCKPERIRRGLIIDSIPGIQGQAEIGVAEAGERRRHIGRRAGVSPRRSRRVPIRAGPGRLSAPSSIEVACIAAGLAAEQVVTGLLVCSQRVVACQEGVEFRRESADTR